MQILFIAERFPPEIGGVSASAGRIARSLCRLGHTVHVVTLTRDLPAGSVARPTSEPDGVHLHRLGQSRNLDFTLQQAQTYLEWLHARHRFHLVWGHYVQTAGFLAAWLGQLLGLPSLLALRGNDFDRQVFPPGDFARLRWCLERATHLVAVSRDLARKVRALIGREPTVLANTVDTNRFHLGPRPMDLAERYGLAEGELVLGFSGELRAKKGLTFLLQALAEVRQRQRARLLVIGEVRGGDQGEFERARVGLGLDEGICVTGHVDPGEVARHLCLCDLYVLPSLWEGMPNGLLEAMACGVPVVASDAGGIPEIVEDGVNGLIVPRTHLHHLGRRLLEWLALPATARTALATAARRTVEERYDSRAEEAALTGLLETILGEGQGKEDRTG